MTLWPLTLLLLCAFAGASITIDHLSWEAQEPYLKGLHSEKGLLYSSMCIGSDPKLVRRCLISAARWRYVVKERDIPLVYYVRNFPQEAITYLKSFHNVYVVELSEIEWLPSQRYPTPPERFYSFYKLAVFNLYGYRVLWFDSDAYLFQNPTPLFHLLPADATGDEVVAWKAPSTNLTDHYFNSGLMVFMPNKKLTQRIYDTWASGDYRMHFKVSEEVLKYHLTEQEVLLSVFPAEHLIQLPHCTNFRTHNKYAKINRQCTITQVVALHDWQFFAEDPSLLCNLWKKTVLMGSSPLLCEADKLPEGAPEFSLDVCSPFFTPPSKTHLCDPSISYSPTFLPTESEIIEHFMTRRQQRKLKDKLKKRKKSLEIAGGEGVGQEGTEEESVEKNIEKNEDGGGEQHHYLDKFRHQQNGSESNGEGERNEEKSGDGGRSSHPHLMNFRKSMEQKNRG